MDEKQLQQIENKIIEKYSSSKNESLTETQKDIFDTIVLLSAKIAAEFIYEYDKLKSTNS